MFITAKGDVMATHISIIDSVSDKITILNKILDKGKMNDTLRNAIIEVKEALANNDLELAYEVSAVKSYIASSGKDLPSYYHFIEDWKSNEEALGSSIYSLLDSMHHDLAFALNKMPSGMMVVSFNGWRSKGPPTRESPTLTLITLEHEEIRKRAENKSS